MIFGEEDARPPQPQNRPQTNWSFDTAQMQTVYANLFMLAGSQDELVLYLGANSALPGKKENVVALSHRVILLPQNAKRLMLALQQSVKAHEDRFGPIEVNLPRTSGDSAS